MFGYQDFAPIIFVALKYNGEVCLLNSNNPEMRNLLPFLTLYGSPYFAWRNCSVKKPAHDYQKELEYLYLLYFIPEDPMIVKAEQWVYSV